MTTRKSFFSKKTKIIKYILVTETDTVIFCEQIQKLINNGYNLQGGVTTTHSPRDNRIIYSQSRVMIE